MIPVFAFRGEKGVAYVIPAERLMTDVVERVYHRALPGSSTDFYAVPLSALRVASGPAEYDSWKENTTGIFSSQRVPLRSETELGLMPKIPVRFGEITEEQWHGSLEDLVEPAIKNALEETRHGTNVYRMSEALPESRVREKVLTSWEKCKAVLAELNPFTLKPTNPFSPN